MFALFRLYRRYRIYVFHKAFWDCIYRDYDNRNSQERNKNYFDREIISLGSLHRRKCILKLCFIWKLTYDDDFFRVKKNQIGWFYFLLAVKLYVPNPLTRAGVEIYLLRKVFIFMNILFLIIYYMSIIFLSINIS